MQLPTWSGDSPEQTALSLDCSMLEGEPRAQGCLFSSHSVRCCTLRPALLRSLRLCLPILTGGARCSPAGGRFVLTCLNQEGTAPGFVFILNDIFIIYLVYAESGGAGHTCCGGRV